MDSTTAVAAHSSLRARTATDLEMAITDEQKRGHDAHILPMRIQGVLDVCQIRLTGRAQRWLALPFSFCNDHLCLALHASNFVSQEL